MPLYEYRCTACDRLTEKRQKFSDPEITDCPYCGGKLERTITAPAVQFKGGGWYADGYGSKKPTSSGSGESGTAAGDASGKEGKATEGKADSKSSDAAAPAPATPAGTPAAAPATTAAPSTAPAK